MFGLLKNKIAGFINGLTGREEKKEAPTSKSPLPEEKKDETAAKLLHSDGEKNEKKPGVKTSQAPAIPSLANGARAKNPGEEALGKNAEQQKPDSNSSKDAQKTPAQEPPAKTPHKKSQQVAPSASLPVGQPLRAKPDADSQAVGRQPEKIPAAASGNQQSQPNLAQEKTIGAHHDLSGLSRKASSEKREMSPKIGLGATIKSFFSNEITIGESEVSDLAEELELSLLEADVEYEVSIEVVSQLRSRLVGMKVPRDEVAKRTKEAISQVLESVMASERKFDFLERVRSLPKPAKILFVGPNGAGKTTTMAKVAQKLRGAGLSSVFSASDTFRAAAIEQTEVHGERLGVKVIKSKYGADPASVAFDAINFARSHGIDAVLIDSAGRQDTNANLLSELKKINRVAQPDLKIYVGESIGGNALIGQIRAFHEAIGVDGAILTKLDCDAKGGTAISIAKATGIPIIYLGVGQGYEDLIPFEPHKIAWEIMN